MGGHTTMVRHCPLIFAEAAKSRSALPGRTRPTGDAQAFDRWLRRCVVAVGRLGRLGFGAGLVSASACPVAQPQPWLGASAWGLGRGRLGRRSRLLGAGPLGARGDTQALDRGCGCRGFGSARAGLRGPLPRCLGLRGLGRGRLGRRSRLLGAGPLGARGEPRPFAGAAGAWPLRRLRPVPRPVPRSWPPRQPVRPSSRRASSRRRRCPTPWRERLVAVGLSGRLGGRLLVWLRAASAAAAAQPALLGLAGAALAGFGGSAWSPASRPLAAVPLSGSVAVSCRVTRAASGRRRAPRALRPPLRGDVVDTVGDHHPAERATGGDRDGAGGQRLVYAFVVDPLADVLFHPHPRAAGAAAEAALGVPRHLGQRWRPRPRSAHAAPRRPCCAGPGSRGRDR